MKKLNNALLNESNANECAKLESDVVANLNAINKIYYSNGLSDGATAERQHIKDVINWFIETHDSEYVLYGSESLDHLINLYDEFSKQSFDNLKSMINDINDEAQSH